MLNRRIGHRAQRGLSLVELMVGITVGLFIVASASMLMATQLKENRLLLLETQLQQDLRATADIITREVRRAGYWPGAEAGVWQPTAVAAANPFQALVVTSGEQGAVKYNYKRPDNAPGLFEYKLESGVIKSKLSSGSAWQDLTDIKVLSVEKMEIVLTTSPAVYLSCPKSCPAPAFTPVFPATAVNYCWPKFEIRELEVKIRGNAVNDSAITREVVTRARLRNDSVKFYPIPGGPVTPEDCPA